MNKYKKNCGIYIEIYKNIQENIKIIRRYVEKV